MRSSSGIKMKLISTFFIKLSAKRVGSDSFGNTYYEKQVKHAPRPKRFVIYKGATEASKVPADWHGWLHYTEATPPPEGGYDKADWQSDHLPNLTGTKFAHRPKGHVLKGGKRAPSTGDYEAWTP
ncbi:MAG: NADH:ubiquinone oxidoreductase subunit NDUFA12 [Candidatus Puniceispirillaceae bacterium]